MTGENSGAEYIIKLKVMLFLWTPMPILGGVEAIRDQMSPTAYGEVASLLGNINSIALLGVLVPVIILMGFFLYRFFVFQPKKNRFLTLRFRKTGGVRLSIDTLKPEMPFDARDPMTDKLKVNNPKKHFDESSGKPLLFLFEGDDSNADLCQYAKGVDEKGRDTNTINDMAFALGRRYERQMQEDKGGFLTPVNILLILILGAIAFVAFIVLKNPETTAALIPAMMRF